MHGDNQSIVDRDDSDDASAAGIDGAYLPVESVAMWWCRCSRFNSHKPPAKGMRLLATTVSRTCLGMTTGQRGHSI